MPTIGSWVLGWVAVALVSAVVVPMACALTADHLIISEVNWPATRAPKGSQAIKLVNPTASAIALDDVYLTDATLSPSAMYYNITLTTPAAANPGGTAAQDFHVRFPAGATVAAGDTLVIAVNGSEEYIAEYGVTPDYELVEDGLNPDAIPDLVAAFPGSVNVDLSLVGTEPVLDRTVESLVLYTWDGETDLVQDLDYLVWGTNTNARVDKSGVTIGSDTYLADTAVTSQTPAATSLLAGQSLRRASDDEGDGETDGGTGNGLTGHDETGENLGATFGTETGFDVPAPPASATPAAPVLTVEATVPAIPNAGGATTLSVAVDSYSTVTSVTFYYTVDGGAPSTVTGTEGAGAWTGEVPQQAEGTVIAWWAEAVNSDGGSALIPVSAPLYVNSYTVGAAPVTGEGAEKLMFTEVSYGPNVYPFTGIEDFAFDFVEIYNPNDYDVDLSDYYLTDATSHYPEVTYGGDPQLYFQIANGEINRDRLGGGDYSDFFARFPDGYTIGAGELVVISIAPGDLFEGEFGFLPDIALYEAEGHTSAAPVMREVFANSIYGGVITDEDLLPELDEHYGESLVLFHWDGNSDLVTDVDFFANGTSKTGAYSVGFDKTGITSGSSTYADDTPIDSQAWYSAVLESDTQSYQRSVEDEGDQTATGGNGVDGRDETSENFTTTYDTATFTPGTWDLSNNGGEPTGDAAKLLMTEISYGPNVYPFQGIEDFANDFVEIYNPNDFDVDLSNYYLTDATSHYSEVNFGGSAQVYYNIASGAANRDRLGGGDYSDFFARFPDGYTLGANEMIVVSIAPGDLYEGVFGQLPDIALYEAEGHTSDAPLMREVFSSSIYGGTITDEDSLPELDEHYGESVVLFYWDGQSDLVTDIDFFANGTSNSGAYSVGFDKTGITSGSSAYQDDTPVLSQLWYSDVLESATQSYQRSIADEGDQTATGGNGVDGRDETSEDFVATFAPGPYTPGSWEFAGGGVEPGEETEEPMLVIDMLAKTFIPREGDTYPLRFKITTSGDYEFRLRIFDQEGRLVRTLYDSRFDHSILSGFYETIEWDGRNDRFELVRAGLYLAHFSVIDLDTHNEVTKVMPVVAASRLEK